MVLSTLSPIPSGMRSTGRPIHSIHQMSTECFSWVARYSGVSRELPLSSLASDAVIDQCKPQEQEVLVRDIAGMQLTNGLQPRPTGALGLISVCCLLSAKMRCHTCSTAISWTDAQGRKHLTHIKVIFGRAPTCLCCSMPPGLDLQEQPG